MPSKLSQTRLPAKLGRHFQFVAVPPVCMSRRSLKSGRAVAVERIGHRAEIQIAGQDGSRHRGDEPLAVVIAEVETAAALSGIAAWSTRRHPPERRRLPSASGGGMGWGPPQSRLCQRLQTRRVRIRQLWPSGSAADGRNARWSQAVESAPRRLCRRGSGARQSSSRPVLSPATARASLET